MENEKCPCCGKEIEYSGYTRSCVSNTCPFQCDAKDLPRIAAAMELARAEASLGGADDRFTETERTREDALLRVLEVFGGE